MTLFQRLVEIELQKARAKHPKINSLHEGFAIILEEFDEFKHEVWQQQANADTALKELVQVAAMAQRTAEDCLGALTKN